MIRRRHRISVSVAILVLAVAAAPLSAQGEGNSARGRFVIGAAFGAGLLVLDGPGVDEGSRVSASIVNLKLGFALSERTALVLSMPANLYDYKGQEAEERPRDRGFEGIIPSVRG